MCSSGKMPWNFVSCHLVATSGFRPMSNRLLTQTMMPTVGYQTVTGEKIGTFSIPSGRWNLIAMEWLDREIVSFQVARHVNGIYEFQPADARQIKQSRLERVNGSTFVEADEHRRAVDQMIPPRTFYRPLADGSWLRSVEPGIPVWRRWLHEIITRLAYKSAAEKYCSIELQDRIVTIDRITNRWSPRYWLACKFTMVVFDVSQDGEFAVTSMMTARSWLIVLRCYPPIWIKQILLGFVSFGVLYMLLFAA